MKKSIFIIAVFSGLLGAFSCKKMDSTYKGFLVPNGIVYPGKATLPVIHSGNNRAKISWQKGADPLVVKARVFWNNYTDSVSLDVPADQAEVSVIIPSLPENYYTFIIKTYDAKGNASVPVEVSGNVYGETYRNSLLNRPLVSSTLDLANTLTIVLDTIRTATTIVASEVEYTTASGTTKVVRVDTTRGVPVVITDRKPETSYKLRTLHLSDPLALDTFRSNDQVVDALLLKKSELKIAEVSSVYADGTSAVANMIDNNPATRWISLLTNPYPHFFTVDLGTERTVNSVSLWRWVQATADERGPNTVQFFSSTDNVTFTDLGVYNFNRLTNNEQNYRIPNPVAGRYLKVVALTGPQLFVVLGEVSITVK